MWERLFKKLRGAVFVTKAFKKLHKKMYLEGTTKRLAFLDSQKIKKPLFFIIMPTTKVKKVWTAMSNFLLVYTAIFVPF